MQLSVQELVAKNRLIEIETYQFILPLQGQYSINLNSTIANYVSNVVFNNFSNTTDIAFFDNFQNFIFQRPLVPSINLLYGLGGAIESEYVLALDDNRKVLSYYQVKPVVG